MNILLYLSIYVYFEQKIHVGNNLMVQSNDESTFIDIVKGSEFSAP